jgi:ABC-2 type transport system permease protein
MLAYLFQSALKDFIRPKRVVVWLLIAIATGAAARGWASLTSEMPLAQQYGQLSSILVFRLMALASAIFSTAVISQEVEQKTIVYLLTRPIPRWQLLLTRTLASASVVFMLTAFAALCVSIAVFGRAGIAQPLLISDLGTILMGSLAYGALFVLVSLMLNRAMIVCLLFAFGWESSIPNMPGYLYYVSVYSHLTAIAHHPKPTTGNGALTALSGQLSSNTMPASTAWTVLVCIVVGCMTLGCWWFTHFEYIPREDAE